LGPQQERWWGRLVVQLAPMGLLWRLTEQACCQQALVTQQLAHQLGRMVLKWSWMGHPCCQLGRRWLLMVGQCQGMAQLSRPQGQRYHRWVPWMMGLQWRLLVQQWLVQTVWQLLLMGRQPLRMAQRSPALPFPLQVRWCCRREQLLLR
jgi:hypothetical protein